eukprot:ctg_2337.g588
MATRWPLATAGATPTPKPVRSARALPTPAPASYRPGHWPKQYRRVPRQTASRSGSWPPRPPPRRPYTPDVLGVVHQASGGAR